MTNTNPISRFKVKPGDLVRVTRGYGDEAARGVGLEPGGIYKVASTGGRGRAKTGLIGLEGIEDGHPKYGFDWFEPVDGGGNTQPTGRAPRHYAIGIPVAVTVYDDGRVEFDFDLSEVDDIDEDEDACERYPGTVVTSDVLTVSAAAARVGNTIHHRIYPTA